MITIKKQFCGLFSSMTLTFTLLKLILVFGFINSIFSLTCGHRKLWYYLIYLPFQNSSIDFIRELDIHKDNVHSNTTHGTDESYLDAAGARTLGYPLTTHDPCRHSDWLSHDLAVKPRIAKSFDSYLVMLPVLMFRIFNIALLEPKIKSFEISTHKFS